MGTTVFNEVVSVTPGAKLTIKIGEQTFTAEPINDPRVWVEVIEEIPETASAEAKPAEGEERASAEADPQP
jgi:hypothetical protein